MCLCHPWYLRSFEKKISINMNVIFETRAFNSIMPPTGATIFTCVNDAATGNVKKQEEMEFFALLANSNWMKMINFYYIKQFDCCSSISATHRVSLIITLKQCCMVPQAYIYKVISKIIFLIFGVYTKFP